MPEQTAPPLPAEFDALPDEWAAVLFPEVVYFQEGPGIRNWQYRASGVPFVNIRCLVGGRLDRASMNCLDPSEVDEKYKHFLLDADDFVVSSSGTIGRIAVVGVHDLPCMLNTSVIRMRPCSPRLDRGFLRYFLTSSLYQNQIHAWAGGSVQVNYGPTHLKQMYIVVPPLPEQWYTQSPSPPGTDAEDECALQQACQRISGLLQTSIADEVTLARDTAGILIADNPRHLNDIALALIERKSLTTDELMGRFQRSVREGE